VSGGHLSSIAPTTPVPEPSTWVLLVSGLLAIGLMAWRRSGRPR
jgi:hypothetical protein